jgi:hypothetical protein
LPALADMESINKAIRNVLRHTGPRARRALADSE